MAYNVTVIIPAFNAETTLAQTLDSLLAQTWPGWEAIIVNDGSSDATGAVADAYAANDQRFGVISQPNKGLSGARNTGIANARTEWLLFLDADDWIVPEYLEQMLAQLAAQPELDAVYCGWRRVTPDGRQLDKRHGPQPDDLFATFAYTCAFQPNACIIRRSLAREIDGFDPVFRTCQDWDFWQRAVRLGAQFGQLKASLALYRMRPDSASMNGWKLLPDGLRAITNGHAADPRIKQPAPEYAQGLPQANLSQARLHFVCWAAGLVIGRGESAVAMFAEVVRDHAPDLDAGLVADYLFQACPLPTCRVPHQWLELWPQLISHIDEFLAALEQQAQAKGLARQARIALERMIVEHATSAPPFTVGGTAVVQLEVTEPLLDFQLSTGITQLHVIVELERTPLGRIDVPVFDGIVRQDDLKSAIAGAFAWPILGAFFERGVYHELMISHGPSGAMICRNNICLTTAVPEHDKRFWQRVHDRIGWVVFLQEVWDRPNWLEKHFYNSNTDEPRTRPRFITSDVLDIDVAEELRDVVVWGKALRVRLVVGGEVITESTIPVEHKVVRAAQLRAQLTTEAGFKLCMAVVREGLLGQPLDGSGSLRQRLIAAAQYR